MPASPNYNAQIVLALAIAIWLPLLIIVYYWLRLGLRRKALKSRITELHLEPDYLRVYDYTLWDKYCAPHVAKKEPEKIRHVFEKVFDLQFSLANRDFNYILPFLLTLTSTSLFALVIYDSLTLSGLDAPFMQNGMLPLAVAGALLYISPLYIARYAGLALTPHSLLATVFKMWLAVLVGVLLASLLPSRLQAAGAFLGGLLPVPALEWLKDRVWPRNRDQRKSEAAIRMKNLLQVLHLDEDLLDQLQHIGVRSVLELAYENPLRLFVETDLNLVVCIDLVDQANLWLYVPDEKIRQDLNRFGVRTAIDIMTQPWENYTRDGKTEYRALRHDEDLPKFLEEPFHAIADVMKLGSTDVLRNTMQMMINNPQLEYIRQLWDMIDRDVDHSTDPDLQTARQKSVERQPILMAANPDRVKTHGSPQFP